MSLPPDLKDALRRLRATRAEKPAGDEPTEELALWRERMSECLSFLSRQLLFESDRNQAVKEAEAARAEAENIRRLLKP